jgi:hypothetical protein
MMIQSRREYEKLNRIEDEVDTLLQSVYEWDRNEDNIKLLEEFSDLVKSMNGGYIANDDKLESINRIKKIFDGIEEVNPLILSYLKMWLHVIYERITKRSADIVTNIVESYITESNKNDIMEFYFYVLIKFYTNVLETIYD